MSSNFQLKTLPPAQVVGNRPGMLGPRTYNAIVQAVRAQAQRTVSGGTKAFVDSTGTYIRSTATAEAVAGVGRLGKIMAVHVRLGLVRVALWNPSVLDENTNPMHVANWENAANFVQEDLGANPPLKWIVAWAGGWSGAQPGWPCILIDTQTVAPEGSDPIVFPIALPIVQFHGEPPADQFQEREDWRFHDVGLGTEGTKDVYTNTLPLDDQTIQDDFENSQYAPEGP
jgi:hypothetical protein